MRTMRQSTTEVLICADAAELAREAARRFAELAEAFWNDAGRFTVALSGGSTPKAMFRSSPKNLSPIRCLASIYFLGG